MAARQDGNVETVAPPSLDLESPELETWLLGQRKGLFERLLNF